MGRKILNLLLLALIVLLGGFFRMYRLDKAPPSVNWDEASYAYNAYSLWLTGRDEYGTALPTSIRSFDDFKPPLYAYLSAPFVGVFGLNEITARIGAASFGTITILLIYVLTVYVVKKPSIGLISSLIYATAPQLIHFSRLGFEAELALPLMLIGLIYFLKPKGSFTNYWYGLFFFMLSAFSYNSHKVYFLLGVGWIIFQMKKFPFKIDSILKIGLISSPLIWTSLFTPALARFSTTSIFPLYKTSSSIYAFVGELVNRYVGYFSPANIFVRGTNEPGQQVMGFAVFFPFLIIGWSVGLAWILSHRRSYGGFIWWLLVCPLPAVLTWNWFTPIRVLPFWALLSIVIAVGLCTVFRKMGKISKLILLVVLGGWWYVSSIWSYQRIQYAMPYLQYGRWQWGFRETLAYIKPILHKYDKVVWDTPQAQPYIFVLFYLSYSPNQYFLEIDPKTKSGIPRKIYDFGKFEFRDIYWPNDRSARKTLFIGDPYALPDTDLIRDKMPILHEVLTPEDYILYRIVGTY